MFNILTKLVPDKRLNIVLEFSMQISSFAYLWIFIKTWLILFQTIHKKWKTKTISAYVQHRLTQLVPMKKA